MRCLCPYFYGKLSMIQSVMLQLSLFPRIFTQNRVNLCVRKMSQIFAKIAVGISRKETAFPKANFIVARTKVSKKKFRGLSNTIQKNLRAFSITNELVKSFNELCNHKL